MGKTAFSKVSDLPFLIRTLLINGQGLDLNKLKSDPKISLVVILIVFSGLLAFAVMMVLGRMNYYERIRELVTLKVLGFHRKEMERLVLRENIWITIFGLPFGYIIGTLLLRAILDQATTSDLEILPLITAFSIVGFTFMLAFTMLVNYIMGRKVKGVDMVASLKSIE